VRAVLALALLAGCFKPSPQEGFACFGQERWCPDPLTCQSDGTCRSAPGRGDGGGSDGPGDDVITGGPPNIAFVTSGTFTALSLNGVAGADKKCEDIGTTIGHSGRYVAWLSTTAEPAVQRLGSASGWVRVDGQPFAATKADLLAGKILYPLRRDENNADVVGPVMTGTSPDGASTENCVELSSGSSGDLILIGTSDAGVNRWTNNSEGSCTDQFHIYCLQADTNNVITVSPSSGPIAFMSSPFTPGGGIAAADTVCKNDGMAHGLGNNFKAGLATTSTGMRGHVGIPSARYVRVDGVETTADFINFDASISVTAAGAYLDEQVFSGALHPEDLATSGADDCNDWGNGGTTARVGQSSRATRDDNFGGIGGNCSAKRVYCFGP